MQAKKLMAVLMISLFFTSGCLNALDSEVEILEIDLPLDWNDITQRTATSPDLVKFSDCGELEYNLKESIIEEYRIDLLQSVEEQNYYFWDDAVMMDGDMIAESADSGTGSSNTVTPRRVEGTDFSGTNNQEMGVDEADKAPKF